MSSTGAFAIAQQIGKSLFLPIAILPFAGMLLGIGASFSNTATITAYGLESIFHEGGILFNLMVVFAKVGGVIFGNLPLIFALAVALGMTKKEKATAVLGSAILYLVMLITINVFLTLDGSILPDGSIASSIRQGAIADVLGIKTLQMGVFAGIITGLLAAWICDRFYKQELPQVFAFFGGTRFVPIMCMCFGILSGIIMYFIWPFVQDLIFALGELVKDTGYFGTFIFGAIYRSLIPFGLHHIFYMPFWQTAMGGSMMIDGVQVMGAQNIFFAQLADPNTEKFSVDACRFMMGAYPFMIAGLPAAALAMYTCAKAEKKKLAGSLLFGAGLTSFLTGITEPIEFTFLFLAKELWIIHVLFAGLSFMLCHMFEIAIGTTFSDGFIDFMLYGILPGNDKSNWLMMLPLFVVYAILYFATFKYFIMKWNLKTPGREDDEEEVKLVTKKDYINSKDKSEDILNGIGGIDNVIEVDCCATRLRLTLKDSSKIDEVKLKSTGANGVVIQGNAVQIIYGPTVQIVKANLEEYIENHQPKIEGLKLSSPLTGQAMTLTEVPDKGLSLMGEGLAIEPSIGELRAPADGEVTLVFPTKHAIGMITADGVEILLHIGIDTVKLEGKHFETHVNQNQKVKCGDLLVTFDIESIKQEGYSLVTPMIILNTKSYQQVKALKAGKVEVGESIINIVE